MPTKYGLPLIDLWRGLGVDWSGLPLTAIQDILQRQFLGMLHLPDHFPLAEGLVPYREQIGKRPPQATLELMWCPYAGTCQMIVGYVHPPTEGLAKSTLALTQIHSFTTVKGLEGSSDLPRARAAIIGMHEGDREERLVLHARDYALGSPTEMPLESEADYLAMLKATLVGASTPLRPVVLWNGGFYLWRGGIADSLEAGIEKATLLLDSDRLTKHLAALTAECDRHRPA